MEKRFLGFMPLRARGDRGEICIRIKYDMSSGTKPRRGRRPARQINRRLYLSQSDYALPSQFLDGLTSRAAICAHREEMGGERLSRYLCVRNALHAADEGSADPQKTGNLRAVQLLLGHTKLESTVRYLGIEVDDALNISEQVEL